MGVELNFHGGTTIVALDQTYEYAIIVATGELLVDNQRVIPGQLGYLDEGRDECEITTRGPCKAVLVGGVPFEENILMWWNFVARTQGEIAEAWLNWAAGDERFGVVASRFARIEVGPPPWVLHNN